MLALRAGGLGRLQQLAAVAARRRSAGPVDPRRIDRIAWAAGAVSRRLPGGTCLTRALTTQMLLAAIGQASALRIGVERPAGPRSLAAHAWIETNDRALDAGRDFERYVVLL